MKFTAIEKDRFGSTSDGSRADRFTLRGANGMSVRLINFGATVTELHVPDRDGRLADVVLGFDDLASYETKSPYFGSTVGRTAFRIPYGRFELDGQSYQLDANGGPHHIHGGTKGFSWVVWDAEPLDNEDGPAVRFTYHSPDGDQGYPGAVDAEATYALTNAGELRIEFKATCDRPTPVDMTHHGYFNLAGAGAGDVNDHVVQMAADVYSETDAQVIATGAMLPVAGTPYDFTEPRRIGERLELLPEQSGGYDLAYLNRNQSGTIAPVASVYEPVSGRTMRVLTDAPALIFYGGNYLDGTLQGKGGVAYKKHAGFAMETAGLPDAVNHENFPSIILRPGETYRRTCIYRFTAE